ncbi:hypothetical protein EB06_00731 [Enterococcus cecorum]|uniref:type II toxin-antitoxin system RelB family antitoxin n=1 Tax=Enterococcus cecorum TaxID=44008 RepID=UPI000DE809BB|nr:DUF6290 family protein [Enterococcus cecorum]NLL31876.1 antitoxin [Enterococcus cecorum]RBR33740.1 hypothetical protein EB06_00731 [Enterococcus cecorum]
MVNISISMSKEELAIFKDYAPIHHTSLSSIIRNTMMERIEDEYDMRVFAKYEVEKANGNLNTRSIDELWKELEL